MHTDRPGTSLLEAIAAMTILSTSALVLMSLVAEGMRAVERARRADEGLAAASAFLDAVAVWPREDFERRLGERDQGPWQMYVERSQPTLFEVVLRDSASGRVLLTSSFFRPEPLRAAP